MELWKPCEDYEEYYEVSNTGVVRSIDRTITRSDGALRTYKGKVLATSFDRRGYVNAYLSKEGKDKRVRIHRLVAYAFIYNENEKPQVNHLDGDKSNNNDWNLEWATNLENIQHANLSGLKAEMPFAEKSYKFTGAVEAYKNGILIATMCGNKEMKDNGFDYRLVSAVLMGKRKTHAGCMFIKLLK